MQEPSEKMREEKKLKVTNKKQFAFMVEWMQKNERIAKGFKYAENFGANKDEYNKVWIPLTNSLNSLGPPMRQVVEWQKVWTDFKLKIKKKLAHNKKELRATGGGPNKMFQLSSVEESVISLLSLDKTVEHPGSVFGLESSGKEAEISPQPEALIAAVSTPPAGGLVAEPKGANNAESPIEPIEVSNRVQKSSIEAIDINNNKRKNKKVYQAYRKGLLETQTEYLKQINENLKEYLRYARKTFQLKEKKFKFLQKIAEKKEKRKREELEVKIKILECKKRKLDIQEALNIEQY